VIGFPNPGLKAGLWAGRRVEPVLGRRGMAASAHPLVTGAAVDVLRRGGNAVDAAVAAGLVAAVVLPDACGLGGDLFAIVQAPGAPPVAFLGSGIAPRGASLEAMRAAGTHTATGVKMPHQGPLSAGVPGMVDGYRALMERFGRWTLAAVLEPAIGYAQDGFALTPAGARTIAWSADLLRRHASTAAVFLPGGDLPAAGSMLRQPDLARTLRRIGEAGPEDFYRGEIARRIGAAFEASGGALRASDLADHATVVEPTISTT
jgi:gamma-glutamyltranspeptidase/glutathione hydrolase